MSFLFPKIIRRSDKAKGEATDLRDMDKLWPQLGPGWHVIPTHLGMLEFPGQRPRTKVVWEFAYYPGGLFFWFWCLMWSISVPFLAAKLMLWFMAMIFIVFAILEFHSRLNVGYTPWPLARFEYIHAEGPQCKCPICPGHWIPLDQADKEGADEEEEEEEGEGPPASAIQPAVAHQAKKAKEQ